MEYPPGIDSPLNKSINVNLNLTLPKRLTYSDIKYLSVWNPKLEADFASGDVHPADLKPAVTLCVNKLL